jgi:hypothetical protein
VRFEKSRTVAKGKLRSTQLFLYEPLGSTDSRTNVDFATGLPPDVFSDSAPH